VLIFYNLKIPVLKESRLFVCMSSAIQQTSIYSHHQRSAIFKAVFRKRYSSRVLSIKSGTRLCCFWYNPAASRLTASHSGRTPGIYIYIYIHTHIRRWTTDVLRCRTRLYGRKRHGLFAIADRRISNSNFTDSKYETLSVHKNVR